MIRLAFQTEAADAVIETLRLTDFLTVLPSYAIHTKRPSGLATLPIDLPSPINTVNMITLNDQLEIKLLFDFKEHVRRQVAFSPKNEDLGR